MNEMVPIRPEKSSLDMAYDDAKPTRPKDLEPVVNHPGKRKTSLAKKAANTFLAEDIDNVKQFIIFDVIVPGIKEAFLSSIEMLLFGSTRRGGRRNVGRTNERVSYDAYYDSARDDRRDRRYNSRSSRKSSLEDIELYDRYDAERVIEKIQRRIRDEGYASLANLFQLCDMSFDHTDYNWGWERGQEREFVAVPVYGGRAWTIETPKLKLLQ